MCLLSLKNNNKQSSDVNSKLKRLYMQLSCFLLSSHKKVTREQTCKKIFCTSVSFLNSAAKVTDRTQVKWPENFQIGTEQATGHEPPVENDYMEQKFIIILSVIWIFKF